MEKYDVKYSPDGHIVTIRKMNKEELNKFLKDLPKENNSSLRVTKIDEDELER